MDDLAAIARDTTTVLFYLTPAAAIAGSQSLAQIWKLSHRNRTGRKPSGYMVALVATLICAVLALGLYYLLQGLPLRRAAGFACRQINRAERG